LLHAVIQTGGKQYRVAEGDVLFVEKLESSISDTITFNDVLAIQDDGGESKFGTTYISGASVTANIVKHGKAKKIRVFKMKPKKNYRRTYGHRQPYTQIQIQSIIR